MNLIPRRPMYWAFALAMISAVLIAVVEGPLLHGAIGPIIAATYGPVALPILWRGASSGTMRRGVAWLVTSIGCVFCVATTMGLDAARMDAVSISWYSCGVLAGVVMIRMAGHCLPALLSATCLLVHTLVWAGPIGVIRLGIPSEVVLVAAGLIMRRAMARVTTTARAATAQQREITIWRADQEAYHSEREMRLRQAGRAAAPILQKIIDEDGDLDAASRAECRVLEHTLRDEIRGRRLLNDAVRRTLLAHRRRGAVVQVLDDGGLDDIPARMLSPLLAELAQRLEPLRSSNIVIRTGNPESATAITVVATTPDETAAALGLDDDDHVDLWATIQRPALTAEQG